MCHWGIFSIYRLARKRLNDTESGLIERLKNVGDVPKTRDQVIARQSYFTDSELHTYG